MPNFLEQKLSLAPFDGGWECLHAVNWDMATIYAKLTRFSHCLLNYQCAILVFGIIYSIINALYCKTETCIFIIRSICLETEIDFRRIWLEI